MIMQLKGGTRRLISKAHILDEPWGKLNDGLKIVFGLPCGQWALELKKGS